MPYSPFDEDSFDVAAEMIREFLSTNTRPKREQIETTNTRGHQTDEARIDAEFIRVRGSELLVPRLSVFAAFGGRLDYDLLFVIGFDGARNPLHDVRFMQRPERNAKPIAASRIRQVPLDRLVREATAMRPVWRRLAPDLVWRADDAERDAVNALASQAARYTARSSATNAQLKVVAEEYRLAVLAGDYPTKRVQAALDLPTRDVAAKWVQKARRAGLLPPALGERKSGFKK